jgi:hypothetical protein
MSIHFTILNTTLFLFGVICVISARALLRFEMRRRARQTVFAALPAGAVIMCWALFLATDNFWLRMGIVTAALSQTLQVPSAQPVGRKRPIKFPRASATALKRQVPASYNMGVNLCRCTRDTHEP